MDGEPSLEDIRELYTIIISMLDDFEVRLHFLEEDVTNLNEFVFPLHS